LPELLTFAYIPANHLKFNAPGQQTDSHKDVFSDYSGRTHSTQLDENEHVLVLEMDDGMVRKKKNKPPPDSQVSLGIEPVFQLIVDVLARISFRNLSILPL
jgi:hypothetical protein